jgi:hypothetical protein
VAASHGRFLVLLWSQRTMRQRPVLAGAAILALTCFVACGESAEDAAPPPQAAAPVEAQAAPEPPVDWTLYRFAGADQCDLLRAADPATLLGVEIDPEPLRVYGVCRLHGKDGVPAKWPTTDLEMRKDPEHGIPKNLDEFWEREGAGGERRGAKREQIEELHGIGDYALWYPFSSGQGLQLHAFWGAQNIMLITVVGAPVERAFPWAKELAKNAIAAASAASAR